MARKDQDSGFMEVKGDNNYQVELEMNKLQKENKELHQKIDTLKQQIDDQASKFEKEEQALMDKRRVDLRAKNGEIDDLRKQLDVNERRKQKLKRENKELNVESIRKDISLADSRKKVAELEKQLETLKNKTKKLKNESKIPSSNQKYRTQQKELEQSREEIELLKMKLEEMNDRGFEKDMLLKTTIEQSNNNVRKMVDEMEEVKGAMAVQARDMNKIQSEMANQTNAMAEMKETMKTLMAKDIPRESNQSTPEATPKTTASISRRQSGPFHAPKNASKRT